MACGNCTTCKGCGGAKARGLGFLNEGGSFDDYQDWSWYGDFGGGGGDAYYDWQADANYDWLSGGWSDGYTGDDWSWFGADNGYYGYPSYDEFAQALWEQTGYTPQDLGIDDPYAAETALSVNTDERFNLPSFNPDPLSVYYPQSYPATSDYDPWAEIYGNPPAAPAAPTAPRLPGACPRGYYHPLNNPYACVPFPAPSNGAQSQRKPQPPQQGTQPRQPSKPQTPAQPKCPANTGLQYNPQTQRCECPKGTAYNAQAKRCVVPTVKDQALLSRTPSQQKKPLPWWVIAAILGGAFVLMNDGKKGGRR